MDKEHLKTRISTFQRWRFKGRGQSPIRQIYPVFILLIMGKKKSQSKTTAQKEIQNPHDKFLKRTLEDLEKVVGTLQGVLPSKLFDRLELDSLQKEDTSYINNKLKQFFSDIVYSCRTKDDIPLKIAFLFEHKSYPPDYPHLQLMRYMLEMWDRQAKEKQPLSIILPILIYHGQETWEYQPFASYFEGKLDGLLGKYVPLFSFLAANFQESTYQEIAERFQLVSLRIAFRLMKSIRDDDLAQKLPNIFEGLPELAKDEHGRIYFESIIVYLLFGSKAKFEEVMESLYNISREAGEFANSPAMQLIRKGREEASAEAQAKIQEALRKEAEARKKELEARKKEAEANKILKKQEAERKSGIRSMLKAGMKKEQIADFMGITLKKLEGYIREIRAEDANKPDQQKGE